MVNRRWMDTGERLTLLAVGNRLVKKESGLRGKTDKMLFHHIYIERLSFEDIKIS